MQTGKNGRSQNALENVNMNACVAPKNGYIGYIIDSQRLKRLQIGYTKVTSVTLLIYNNLSTVGTWRVADYTRIHFDLPPAIAV